MHVINVVVGMPMTLMLLVFHMADSRLICSHGMQSTIQSINQILDPVTNRTCQSSEVCGVATMKIQYNAENGQGKIGTCIPSSLCSSTTGCQLAIRYLPSGVSSQECKAECCSTNHCNSLLVSKGSDEQLVCSHGMDSTIQSLNQVIDPVTNKTCQPTEVCGVATVTMKYGSVTGQGKIGSCVPNSSCSGSIGCQLAIKNLPSGVSSEECKAECCSTNHCNSLLVSKGSDGQLVCSEGMDSTIQSLNQVLDPVTNKKCQPTEVCGVATVTMKYGGVTGQGKIGSCVPNSFCSGAIGCQLAIKNLPSGVSSEECKSECCNISHCNSLLVSKSSSITKIYQTAVAAVTFHLVILLC